MAGDTPECFVIMPMTTRADWVEDYGGENDHFQLVLDHLFTPAIEALGYAALPPAARGSDIIQAYIIEKLITADLVLCDMSRLNPNVFFELGIRVAVDKPVAYVRDSLTPSIPFDVGLIHCHKYGAPLRLQTINGEIETLRAHLHETVDRVRHRPSLWQSFGMTVTASRPPSPGEEDKLDYLVRAVQDLGDRIADVADQDVEWEPVRASIHRVRAELQAWPAVTSVIGLEEDPGTLLVGMDHLLIAGERRRIQELVRGLGYEVHFALHTLSSVGGDQQ